jgi:polyisoprenoid-binding protein YceI
MAVRKSVVILCATWLASSALAAPAAAPCYTLDSDRSVLRFVAEQMGAKFEGSFRRFQAKIAFSPDDLATSRFDVIVDPASADTQEEQRDATLHGPDFFDVEHFRSANFVTTAFRKLEAGNFEATGKLTLRDVTRDVKIIFSFTTRKEGGTEVGYLVGNSSLKRLDFGIGRGDYADTEAVGDDVEVKFNLRLLPAPRPPDKKIPRAPTRPEAQ